MATNFCIYCTGKMEMTEQQVTDGQNELDVFWVTRYYRLLLWAQCRFPFRLPFSAATWRACRQQGTFGWGDTGAHYVLNI
jgi:hypothetical protein